MSTTALRRLLKYPHQAVFDGSPVAELAFRLQHEDGASWSVGDRVFTAKAGALEVTHDLRQFTVNQLVNQLMADGFTIVSPSPRFSGISSLVLVDGSGSQNVSNGDHVTAYTSLLWVLLNGYAGEVLDAEEQVRQALLQMVITTASGEWLDLWGALYGVPRNPGESDAHFVPRIPREAFRVRNNARAIELAIRDATGFDVRIKEPWTNIFKLDGSLLSGPDKFYDGETIGYHLIQPVAREAIDWPSVRGVIEKNRAAGVMIVSPHLFHGSHSILPSPVVLGGVLSLHTRFQRVDDRVLLDYNAIEDVSILNHAGRHRREVMHSSMLAVTSGPWGGFTWGSGGTWTDPIYAVTSRHFRDYRVTYSDVVYSSLAWNASDRTWGSAPPESWSSLNAIIGSSHTRES